MDILLNEVIDNELKSKFLAVVALSPTYNKNRKIEDLLASEELICFIDFICGNAEFNWKKTRDLLHIILYVYVYSAFVGDEILADCKFEDLIEDNTVDKILYILHENETLEYCVIQIYLEIIFDESLLETIQSNLSYCEKLESFYEWGVGFDNEFDLISDKLRKVLDNYIFSASLVNENKPAEIALNFLYNNIDFLGIVTEEFSTFKDYLQYKPILIEIIFMDTYLYLKSREELTADEEETLKCISEFIEKSEISKLPDDRELTKKMLYYFSAVTFDKSYYKNNYPKQTEDTKKLARIKAHPITYLDYASF